MSNTTAADFGNLVLRDRVHGDAYCDPQVFEREIDGIFSRDQQGQVRVLMNRCTHRANAVCHLERGNAAGFTCPYHGWRFRLDGELASVPYPDRYDADFDKSRLGLRHARVESRRGFVFATLNPDDVPLDVHLGALVLAELDDIADLSPVGELLINAGVHRVRFVANWKLMVENAIDGYHANPVHRSHFENVRARTGFDPAALTTSSSPARIRDLGHGHCAWDSSSIIAKGTRNFPGNRPTETAFNTYRNALIERHGEARADHLLTKSGSHLYIFPNFVYVGAHYRLMQPMSVNQTWVQLFPIMLKGVPQEINTRRLRTHEVFYGPAGFGQSDDIEIFERNQIGLSAALDPWSLIARGIHLETRHEDGSISGQITDELSNRAVWGRWRELMTSEEDAA
jgi:phenylpropionate dioxygenase-like ring-hydroxylating dioxygenase large terminal subunit